MLEKSFGTQLPGEVYRDRVGAYGIIFNDKNQVAVVRTSTGYFLLGGGIENNETHTDCIIRECLEEAGLSVSVGDFICKGDKYHWSDTLEYYMHGVGYFYYAYLLEMLDIDLEIDHELIWLDIKDCCSKLFLEHQSWAVEQAVVQRAK